jgi:lysophospholipase
MEFVNVEGNPVPVGAELLELRGRAGVTLRALFAPAVGMPARGTVIVCNGRTEFIEKYFEVIAELQQRGFAVVTMDWRGQGLSGRMLPDRLKGHVDSLDDAVADLESLVGMARLKSLLPRPWVVLAHSMGGAIALRALQTRRLVAEGAVFCAPMWAIAGVTPFQAGAVRFAAGIGFGAQWAPGRRGVAPGTEPFKGNPVTHDERRYRRNQELIAANPDLALGHPTLGWVAAALESIRAFARPGALQHLVLPVLVLSAGEEVLVDNRSHIDVAAILPAARRIEIPDARHEILMEVDTVRAVFWREFDAFVHEIAPPRAVA